MSERSPAPRRVTGPSGERFEVVGRAGPVKLRRAPRIPAEAGEELLVVKEGALFVCSRPNGDVYPGTATGGGLFFEDTRYLSGISLTIEGKAPVLLSSSAGLAYAAVMDLTNPNIWHDKAVAVPQMTLNIRRMRLVGDRLYERIEIRNHGSTRAETVIELSLAADFADMFEVRGVRKRMSRGQALAPKKTKRGVRLAYLGEDEIFRETIVDLDPTPAELLTSADGVTARWPIALEPQEETSIACEIEPSPGGRRRRRRSFETAQKNASKSADAWRASCTDIEGLHRSFNSLIGASLRDLHALVTPVDGDAVITAGIPWYVAPFGRDALITCYEMLLLNPQPARQTLLFLAAAQARDDDAERDAEPGKILHELRVGELARAGYIPHTPYYGSIDSTPLFLMLAAAYYRWTADEATMGELKPALDAALGWIDDFGDQDGDGFVEYLRRSSAGLENQGWKDSEDAVVHADGSLAEGSIALAEVQGYVHLAKQRIAEVYDALGENERGDRLRKEAAALKDAFNEAFWMEDEGTFALALDGAKRQVKSVTSNPGQCLYCDIVEPSKAAPLAERLMAPDMFSGWGIRTLSTESPAFNPMSYHNGSVWPHDNAIIAAGLKRYGFVEATEAIATALFDVAMQSREFRLPELFCGFRRRENVPYVSYPVACSPQAWAAAVPFMILQSMLGISARAPEGTLTVNQPDLPSWLGRIEIRDIRVAGSKVSLGFSRDGETTSFSLLAREGDARVSIQE